MTWHDAPIAQLDIAKIGEALLKLPLVAQQLGHQHLAQTDAYTHPTTAEVRYAHDVVFGLAAGRLTVAEFLERWFGDAGNARDLLRAMHGYTQTAHDAAHEEAATP